MVQNRLVGAGIHHEALGVLRFDGGLLDRSLGFGEKNLRRDLGLGPGRGTKAKCKKDEWTHWKWFGWSGQLVERYGIVDEWGIVGVGGGSGRVQRLCFSCHMNVLRWTFSCTLAQTKLMSPECQSFRWNHRAPNTLGCWT